MLIVAIISGIIFILAAGFWYSVRFTKSRPFKDIDGNIADNSISQYKRMEIRGTKQAVLIRGLNKSNPVIFFIHGGPGSGIIGQFEHNRSLENEFTFVYWDQYGSGKSWSPFINKKRLTIDEFIKDAHFLTERIKEELVCEKVILLGHSWGSYISIRLADMYPEDYSAVINMGQVINFRKNEKESYKYALLKAHEKKMKSAIKVLEKIEGYWNASPPESVRHTLFQRKYLTKLGGNLHERSDTGLIDKYTFNDTFSIFDAIPWYIGAITSATTLLPEMFEKLKLDEDVTELQIPYFLIHGKSDYTTPWYLAEEYYNNLKTSLKRIYFFDESGHEPAMEETEKFNETMVNHIKPLITNNRE